MSNQMKYCDSCGYNSDELNEYQEYQLCNNCITITCDNCDNILVGEDYNFIDDYTRYCDSCYYEYYQLCDNCNNITKKEDIKQLYNSFKPTQYDSLWDLCPKCYNNWVELAK